MSVRVWREPLVKFMADVMVFVLVGWKTIWTWILKKQEW
jgi:hypothetical protein